MKDGDLLRHDAYSLMSSAADPSHYMISVRRDESGRGGSMLLHNVVREGTTVRISRPVNLFPLDLGWPMENIHSGRFIAPAAGDPFDIELSASGKTVHVKRQQSMPEALEAAHVVVPFCAAGAPAANVRLASWNTRVS